MSHVGVIDGLRFAESASEISGTLTDEELPRLSGSDCRVEQVVFSVRGGTSSKGRPCLRVTAQAELVLVCQRCLEPMACSVPVDSDLELSQSLEEIEQADDDIDRVLAAQSMDVAQLVEDEVILALPVAPRHESCTPHADGDELKRASPFDVLARLKQGGRQ
jgi:uncharacterized protein